MTEIVECSLKDMDEFESSDAHVEVVRKQWLFLYSENCYLYLNK